LRAGRCILFMEAVHQMFLTYTDGSRTEAFLLARTENKIRVAIPGSDDPLELTDIRGTWVTEDCEPVRVEFAWQGKTREQVITEADCICSHDLAARLIHLLWNGDEEDASQAEQSILPANIESLAPVSFRN
jgi:hypothetical protein